VSLAFGLSLLAMAYTIGHVSGCHINPAITVGMLLAGKVEAKKAPFYFVGQAVGGLIGGCALWLLFKAGDVPKPLGFAANGFGDHSPGHFALGGVIISEIIMTALLVFVVLGTAHSKFPAGFGGIAAGFTLTVIHLVSINVSNTSVNPARSLAVAPFAEGTWALEQLWAFIVFPLIGAILGAAVHNILFSEKSEPAV
jgi:aquaporin Z